MNTVHLDPKSTGDFDLIASLAKSSTFIFSDLPKVSIKEPHPDEHASLSKIESITPFFILRHFISCPPMSSIKSTPGKK